MTHLKLTDFATGLPVYVQREAIVSCRRLGPHHKAIASNVAVKYFRTRIDTEMDTFYVRETPEEIMEVVPLTPVVAEEHHGEIHFGCSSCGELTPKSQCIDGGNLCGRCRRTSDEVDSLQRSVIGCCDRHADQQACDCMDIARSIHGRESKRKN